MRILHIGKYYPPVPGGMERFLGDLVVAQQRAGHDVAVLVHGAPEDTPSSDPPWLSRCPVWFRLAFAPISPAFPFWLNRAIHQHDPDVLHFHTPNLSAFWALLLPAAWRLPWVIQWQSDVEPSRFRLSLRLFYPFFRVFERALLERAEAVIVSSLQYLNSSVPLSPWRNKCVVIPLGLAADRLPLVPKEAGAGYWDGGCLRLLAIGRLTYYKGFETLIEAVAACRGTELIIVGDGEERPRLEKLLGRLGNPSKIQLFGHADDPTCHRLLASCDVFCLPSRERTESFGVVLMEAMRYGKPLLASDIPGSGVGWLTRNGENGWLVPPEDVAAWRTAIRKFAEEGARREAMGRAGYERFAKELDIASIVPRIDRVCRLAVDMLGNSDLACPVTQQRPAIIIPALDEAASIGAVISLVHAQGYADVYVVDDGSRDDTVAVAAGTGAVVLRAPLSQGAWGAMQTGIRHALRLGYPGVVTMDADGQHEPAYLDNLISAGNTADVVIGAYPERGSRLRQFAWAWFRRLTGFGFEDLTSGFRYYNIDACRILAGEEATLLDYQDIGVLLLLRRAGMRIKEVPVVMNPRHSGASRVFYSWWTVVRYMAETTLLCLARWGTHRSPGSASHRQP